MFLYSSPSEGWDDVDWQKLYKRGGSCDVFLPGSPGKESCLLFVLCFNRVNQGALCYNLKPTVKAVSSYLSCTYRECSISSPSLIKTLLYLHLHQTHQNRSESTDFQQPNISMLMCFVLLPYRLIVMKTKMTLSHLHINMQRADCVYVSWSYHIIIMTTTAIIIIIKQPDFSQFYLEGSYLERSFMPLFKACSWLCYLCSFFAELCGKVFFSAFIPWDPRRQFTKDRQLMPVHHHHEALKPSWKGCAGLLETHSSAPFDAVTCTASIMTSHFINTVGVLAMFPRKNWCKEIQELVKGIIH